MSKIMELRGKRNTLWEQTKNFLEEHRDENGLVAAEFVDQYDRMADEVAKLGKEIERLEQQAEMDARLAQPTTAPVKTSPMAPHKDAVKPTATDEYNRPSGT
jgi:HK97 family phage major capsid protein